MASPKVDMVCRHCGSNRVLRDAFAEWDFEKQEWVLENVFDYAICQSDICDAGETSIEEKPIEGGSSI